jgi:hypothetical protein
MDKKSLDDFNQIELAQFAMDTLRRTILHYGIWFDETQHQLGLEETIRLEQKVASTIFPIVVNRLGNTMGFETKNGIPVALLTMDKEKLIKLIDSMSVNWLASDGVWFQTVENNHDIGTAKLANDTCWSRFSPIEAAMIKSTLKLPDCGGLETLEQALNFRLYARINEQSSHRSANELVFHMVKCRVQEARKRKGLTDYPCKSAGVVEYKTFASAIDSRIKTECLGCPPDPHPDAWCCAWRFYLCE